jgi:hypothetical protein
MEVAVKRYTLPAMAVLLGASSLAGDPPKALAVYVVGTSAEARDPDDATKKALKEKRQAATEARKALEKQLKDQLGKKRDAWPQEKDDELYALEEAEALARADYEYRKIDPKSVTDSVNDIRKSIEGKGVAGRKERVILAGSAQDADLVLEVLARRAEKVLPTDFKPSYCFVFFSIGPGGRTPPNRFAKIPASYRIRKGFGWGIYKIAGPSASAPVFKFESNNQMTSGAWGEFGCHGSAANAAAAAVDKFIEDNYTTLASK